MLDCCGLARFGDDLLGCRNSLLLLALGQMGGAFTCFIDHFLRVRIGLRDNFLVTLLRFSEFLFDFLRIKLAFLDLAPTLLEHSKDWFVSETLQKVCDDAEADDLRQKQFPIPAKRFGCIAQDISNASATRGNNQVHKLSLGCNIDCVPSEINERDIARRKRSPRSARWREFRARALA